MKLGTIAGEELHSHPVDLVGGDYTLMTIVAPEQDLLESVEFSIPWDDQGCQCEAEWTTRFPALCSCVAFVCTPHKDRDLRWAKEIQKRRFDKLRCIGCGATCTDTRKVWIQVDPLK